MIAKRSLFWFMMLTAVLAGPAQQSVQSPDSSVPLSLEDVVKLSQAGVSEDIIITKIKKDAKPFDLSADEVTELKKVGISDTIIKFLLDPSQPYTPPSKPPPSPAPPYPPDANASKVPPDPGLYHFQGEAPVKTDLKMLLGEKKGAGLGKALMKKGKTIAYLVGPTSKTRIGTSAPVFYLRLPEGKGIEEVVLVAFEQKKGRRETQPLPAPEALRQFEPLEVGPHLFRVTISKLGEGEYLFLLVGSAEPPKGVYGKGWDFGIDRAAAPQTRA